MKTISFVVDDGMSYASSFTTLLRLNPTSYAILGEPSLKLQRTSIEKGEDTVKGKAT